MNLNKTRKFNTNRNHSEAQLEGDGTTMPKLKVDTYVTAEDLRELATKFNTWADKLEAHDA